MLTCSGESDCVVSSFCTSYSSNADTGVVSTWYESVELAGCLWQDIAGFAQLG